MYAGDEFYGDEITSGQFDEEVQAGRDGWDADNAKPECILSGTDGNVFAIIGKVSRTLKGVGQRDAAAEFTSRAMSAGSYDDVLALCFEYVDVC